jgi:A/G-specific adenine glycosylase
VTFPSAALLAWYARFGRTHLPWRQTRDPYRVLVSEFMLQQTQVERVLPLYAAFVARFPDFAALAAADAADVVRLWRGLGYNSRAIRLHRIAREVVAGTGTLPRERDALLDLPGIGPYTAAAVRAFAFEADDVALDTNLRRVVHRVMLGLEHPPRANERELDALLRAALPPGSAHDWNSALMDLGATVCTARAPKCLVCPLRDACAAAPVDATSLATAMRAHAKKKSPQEALPFEQTQRFLRGRIIDRLRDLPRDAAISLAELEADLHAIVTPERVPEIAGTVQALIRDGFVVERGGEFALQT